MDWSFFLPILSGAFGVKLLDLLVEGLRQRASAKGRIKTELDRAELALHEWVEHAYVVRRLLIEAGGTPPPPPNPD